MDITSSPPIVNPLMACTLPGPMPFTSTLTCTTPLSTALVAAEIPAVCAATEELFLAFLKPSVPQEVRVINLLSGCVTWMCVLLYVALIWTIGTSSYFSPRHRNELGSPGIGGSRPSSFELWSLMGLPAELGVTCALTDRGRHQEDFTAPHACCHTPGSSPATALLIAKFIAPGLASRFNKKQ